MLQTFLVFLGGGLGAAVRHGVNVGSAKVFGISFPVGTMVVNVTGSLVMGLIVAYLAFKVDQPWSQNMRLFLTTGILGGYTTFSAFSLDFALLWERGALGLAALYVLGSVGLSLAAVFAGLWLVRAFA